MSEHAGTFHANKSHKLAIVVFVPASRFLKQKFVEDFSNAIFTKTTPCFQRLLLLYMKMNNFNVVFHMIGEK